MCMYIVLKNLQIVYIRVKSYTLKTCSHNSLKTQPHTQEQERCERHLRIMRALCDERSLPMAARGGRMRSRPAAATETRRIVVAVGVDRARLIGG